MLRFLLAAAIISSLCSCDIIGGSKVESAVKRALGNDPRTAGLRFEVAYQEGGTVSITGEVQTPEELAAVKEIAARVEGVTSVVNNCHLKEESSGMMQDEYVPLL